MNATGNETTTAARGVRLWVEQTQSDLCTLLEACDGGGKFVRDVWERPGGGGGMTAVMKDGALFEQAGVNSSAVWGEFDDAALNKLGGAERRFYATGVSLVLHPRSPMVPTVHANFRYFERGDDAWFGGGSDLTPYYPYDEDCKHFHSVWKTACDRHDLLDGTCAGTAHADIDVDERGQRARGAAE